MRTIIPTLPIPVIRPWYLPHCLFPDFVWHDNNRSSIPKSQIPATPALTHNISRRFWGFLHKRLRAFSQMYCGWVGIPFDNQIAQLPFGLLLKWSDGTRLEEVLAMKVARSAGFPVPRIITYGEHADAPHAPVSILMTRLPGEELGKVYEGLNENDKQSVLQEIKEHLDIMRGWTSPWGANRICSVTGTAVRSVRVPNHYAGPFESEAEFNEYLIGPASSSSFESEEVYKNTLNMAKELHGITHRIVFTHGDFKHHNILVQGGHITGFLDWESAGWYPDYWEFTTALRFVQKDFWWYEFVLGLGGGLYSNELKCERALTSLTNDSYSW